MKMAVVNNTQRGTINLYVASSNAGKLREFRQAANQLGISIDLLPNLSSTIAPAEIGSTFEENACIKAKAYSRVLPGELVFADDSGLEVAALNGRPGVYSARYAATEDDPEPSDSDNNYRLLYELSRIPNGDRSARFICVIAIARDGEVLATLSGTADGEILLAPLGHGGFGYDPLFYVPAKRKTFAELSEEEKLEVSHRGKAFRELLRWLIARNADSSPATAGTK
jgi:XTP/dITP diphosphohydrolase